MEKKNEKLLKVRFTTYNGGRYGKTGEYIAIIKPVYKSNGEIKKTDFEIVEILQTIKKGYGYGYGNAVTAHSIKEILGEI